MVEPLVENNSYDGYRIVSKYPPPPTNLWQRYKRWRKPPDVKLTIAQNEEAEYLPEDWLSALGEELLKDLGPEIIRRMVVVYERGEPWRIRLVLDSSRYNYQVHQRIRSCVDWVLENHDAEMMGGPGDDLVYGPQDM